MSKYIVAVVVGVFTVLFATGLSYVVYKPNPPKVYNEKLEKVPQRGFSMEEGTGTGAAAAEEAAFDLPTALAAANPDDGAKVAKKCLACHDLSKGGPNKVGPNLYGVLGRPKGSHEGFEYSDGMKGKGGSWTYDDLFAFLSKPSEFVPGTKMSFAGFKKKNDAAKVIAYLRTLNDNPPALPPVTAQPAAEAPPAAEAAPEAAAAKQ